MGGGSHLRAVVREEAELEVSGPHRLPQREDLLGARVVGLELAEQRPLPTRVGEGAQHLQLAHRAGVVLRRRPRRRGGVEGGATPRLG